MTIEPSGQEILQLPVKKHRKKIIGGLILIPILFILYLIIGPFLHILSRDISAKEMFVISEFVNVRATSDVNSLKMGQLDYGTKVLVYEIKKEWAEVLVDGQKVYISSDFIVDPIEYYTIEGLFGDKKAADIVNSSKYRLALYRYLESKGYTSEIPDEFKDMKAGEQVKKECYQIFTEPKGYLYNSTCFADFDGDFNQDAAFILKKKDSDKKILLILSFDKKDPLNQSKVIYDQELDQPWMFIKLAKKGTKCDVNLNGSPEKKTKILVNGLLIGSNRSSDLNDPVQLLLYNGQKFELHKQQNEKK